jgi:S-adenosylmethionine uptake transporter
MAVLFFWGLVRMPMAEAMALSFVAPLIALYLAAVLLGERIRASAVIGSLLGILGVAVIAMGQFGDGRTTASPWGLAADGRETRARAGTGFLSLELG